MHRGRLTGENEYISRGNPDHLQQTVAIKRVRNPAGGDRKQYHATPGTAAHCHTMTSQSNAFTTEPYTVILQFVRKIIDLETLVRQMTSDIWVTME